MVMLVIQTTLLVIAAYLLGCLLFAFLRAAFSAPRTALAGTARYDASDDLASFPGAVRAPSVLPYRWSGRIERGRIVLSGSTPSAKTRSELSDLARTANPGVKIDDRMAQLNGAPQGWRPAAAVAVKALSDLGEGRVWLKDLALTIEGRAASEQAYARLKAAAKNSTVQGLMIDVSDLRPPSSGATAIRAAKRAEPVPAAVVDRPIVSPANLSPTEAEIEARLAALPESATSEQRADVVGTRPKSLVGPRGKADDLKRVKGIGPKNEKVLNGLGVYHFDQIAGWSDAEVRWVDAYIAFPGRIAREGWIGQCALLARGGETEHSQKVDRGEAS